jgi:hypothetical protein
MIPIPGAVLEILGKGGPEGGFDQAYPLLTVDQAGFPHVALLSRHQVRPGARPEELLAAVWGAGTRANLLARRRATLIAVDGTAAHYLKFSVLRATEQLARLGLVLGLTDHVSDTAGVELLPLSFRSSAGLAAREGWDRDAAVLAFLEQDG